MYTVWTGFGLETAKRSRMQCWCDVTAPYRAVALAYRSRGFGADKRVVGLVSIVEGHSSEFSEYSVTSNGAAWMSWKVYSVIAYRIALVQSFRLYNFFLFLHLKCVLYGRFVLAFHFPVCA